MKNELTREEAIQDLEAIKSFERYARGRLALDTAIEALKREAHDGCDGCRYEENDELTLPCASCKQNYTDKYMPKPKHDRDWIVGCIKHDGFIETDRGDKANQIILEALEADTVEVVRCKDCRYANECHKSVQYTRNAANTVTIGYSPIEWCSRGERSEE